MDNLFTISGDLSRRGRFFSLQLWDYLAVSLVEAEAIAGEYLWWVKAKPRRADFPERLSLGWRSREEISDRVLLLEVPGMDAAAFGDAESVRVALGLAEKQPHVLGPLLQGTPWEAAVEQAQKRTASLQAARQHAHALAQQQAEAPQAQQAAESQQRKTTSSQQPNPASPPSLRDLSLDDLDL